MKVQLCNLALAASSLTFLFPYIVSAGSSSISSNDDIVPVQQLIDSANLLLAQGDMRGALDKFDAAIKKDPSNYLTLFKRGATYLSLGKSSQASADFDAVLTIKPDFEAALLQRAKLKAKAGEWRGSRKDYKSAGGNHDEEINELKVAEEAMKAAEKAEKKGDMEKCIENAGIAIRTASQNLQLKSMRARCRFAKGEVYEAIGDLTHVLALHPSLQSPHLQITSNLYYSLADYDRAIAQIKKCLQFDPESKECKRVFRRIKALNKDIEKLKKVWRNRQFNTAAKLLVGSDQELGILKEVKEDIKYWKEQGCINDASPQGLLAELLEMTCDSYMEMLNHKRAAPHCEATLQHLPYSLPAVLFKAKRLLDEDLFEDAIRLLDSAKEHHPQDRKLHETLQKARTLLRRSKQKDYYKVLGVSRDASEKEIKKAYRTMTKQYHPDKYRGDLSKEEVEKKMGQINEAFEVLNNPELKARFDAGEDPNDHSQQNPFAQGGHPFGFPGGQQYFFQGGGNPFGHGQHFKFNF